MWSFLDLRLAELNPQAPRPKRANVSDSSSGRAGTAHKRVESQRYVRNETITVHESRHQYSN